LAIRWSVALRYIKYPKTFDCSYCESKGNLKKDRNCGWLQPGVCNTCGDTPFDSVETDQDSFKFVCPGCGGKVRFGGSADHVLGKSYRTPGCPKSMITERSIFLIQLVDWSDQTGILPTATSLLDESMLFYEIRNFIISERNAAEEEMAPKDK